MLRTALSRDARSALRHEDLGIERALPLCHHHLTRVMAGQIEMNERQKRELQPSSFEIGKRLNLVHLVEVGRRCRADFAGTPWTCMKLLSLVQEVCATTARASVTIDGSQSNVFATSAVRVCCVLAILMVSPDRAQWRNSPQTRQDHVQPRPNRGHRNHGLHETSKINTPISTNNCCSICGTRKTKLMERTICRSNCPMPQ